MRREVIQKLRVSFEDCSQTIGGVEFWFARDLQKLLDYGEWRNFTNTIEKAKTSCHNAGQHIADHFVEVNKMVKIGSGTERPIDDVLQNRPLADFLPTITITAKNLAVEITNFNVKKGDLRGEGSITKEHVKNNAETRKLLGARGIKPEILPPEEDLKPLVRKVKADEQQIAESSKRRERT